MSDRLNKTSICSIIFLDIVEYSIKSGSEQIAEKTLFNSLVGDALKDVAQTDRIILDTGDGAAIALMGEPEEALFVSLTIRDVILAYNQTSKSLIKVRIGINLGSVRVVKDINGQLNILGDGINVAQRIMSFAEPNQIMVSRSYFEVTSRLTKELTNMFIYSGIKQDKHVREHEIYLINPSANVTNTNAGVAEGMQTEGYFGVRATALSGAGLENIQPNQSAKTALSPWRKYVAWALPLFSALLLLGMYSIKSITQPSQRPAPVVIFPAQNTTIVPATNVTKVEEPKLVATDLKTSNNTLAQHNKIDKKVAKLKLANTQAGQQTSVKHKAHQQQILEHKTVDTKHNGTNASLSKGCTTVEAAMNQCR